MVTTASRHEASSLSAYMRVVRRRLWIVLVCAILVPATAYFVSARQPKVYRASADVYLSTEDIAGALTGLAGSYVDEIRLADTQARLAQVPLVAERAIERSGLKGISPGALLGGLTVVPVNGTNILSFTVTNGDRAAAAKLATAYAQTYTVYRGELDSRAVTNARKEIKVKLAELEAKGGGSQIANSLRSKDQLLETVAALQTSRTYVVRTADGAVRIAPTPRKNASLGLMLGLILGIGLAFLIELFDTRVRSGDEVGKRLGLPQLARITPPPKALAKQDSLVMIAQPSSPDAEVFRMLRTNLDFATLGNERPLSILVTSAIEQEGKSTTAANLAVAEARAGLRVALVDLDLRLPYLARFFGLMHAEGITDVALGRVSLESALERIDLDTGLAAGAPGGGHPANGYGAGHGYLDVLVSGPRPPDPGEFVGSRRLGEILMLLRESYDLIIVDTPPALRVGDAMTLSTRVDGIVVVTKISSIRRPMLLELKRMLEKSPTGKLGYIVTGTRTQQAGDYGYNYGYGYGDSAPSQPQPVEVPASVPAPKPPVNVPVLQTSPSNVPPAQPTVGPTDDSKAPLALQLAAALRRSGRK